MATLGGNVGIIGIIGIIVAIVLVLIVSVVVAFRGLAIVQQRRRQKSLVGIYQARGKVAS